MMMFASTENVSSCFDTTSRTRLVGFHKFEGSVHRMYVHDHRHTYDVYSEQGLDNPRLLGTAATLAG